MIKKVCIVSALVLYLIGIVHFTGKCMLVHAEDFKGTEAIEKSVVTTSQLEEFGVSNISKFTSVFKDSTLEKIIGIQEDIDKAKELSMEADLVITAHVNELKQKAEQEALEIKLAEERRIQAEIEATTFTPVEEVFNIPTGLGNLHTYTEWDKFNWAYDCKSVIIELGGVCKQQAGHIVYSPEGFVKYGSWYAAAMTSSFGNVGDMILIVQDNDTVFPVIIADHKCQTYTSYDHNPANMYGHLNGKCMVEFEVTKNNTIYNGSGSNAGPQFNHYIKQVINVGNVYENKDYIENAEKVFRHSSVSDKQFIPVPC